MEDPLRETTDSFYRSFYPGPFSPEDQFTGTWSDEGERSFAGKANIRWMDNDTHTFRGAVEDTTDSGEGMKEGISPHVLVVSFFNEGGEFSPRGPSNICDGRFYRLRDLLPGEGTAEAAEAAEAAAAAAEEAAAAAEKKKGKKKKKKKGKKGKGACHVCGEEGHLKRDCPQNENKAAAGTGKSCWNCGVVGHLTRDCDQPEVRRRRRRRRVDTGGRGCGDAVCARGCARACVCV